MSYTCEAREHSNANMTHNTDPYRARYRYKCEDFRIEFTYCCGLWVFVWGEEKERKRYLQWMKIKRGVFCYCERDTTLQIVEQNRPDDLMWGFYFFYLWARRGCEMEETPSGRTRRFTLEAQRTVNNIIWFDVSPLLTIISVQSGVAFHSLMTERLNAS